MHFGSVRQNMNSQFQHNRFSGLFLGALLLTSACASVPMSSSEKDAEAKKFNIPPTHSRIYLYRNEALGSAMKVAITLDGRHKGKTARNIYFSWDVKPGEHELSCLAETDSTITVNAKPGKAHFVWQEMKMGLLSAGCALHEVDQSVGKKAILSCNLAKSH